MVFKEAAVSGESIPLRRRLVRPNPLARYRGEVAIYLSSPAQATPPAIVAAVPCT
jgi:hypothetical protein